MRALDLPKPEFIEQHEFVVIFRNGVPLEAEPDEVLNPRQVIGLQIVQQVGSISSSEYRAATGATESTALRDLQNLVDRGVLVTRGKKRGRGLRYYLP